jgi:O-antigen/teichoic acid export membrane protein
VNVPNSKSFFHGHFRSPAAVIYGRVLAILANLLSAGFIAQILGPTGRGISSYALVSIIAVSAVLGFGLPQAARKAAKDSKMQHAIGNSALISAGTLIFSIPSAFLVANALGDSLSGLTRLILTIGVSCAPILTFSRVLQAALNGRGSYFRYILAISTQPIILLFSVLTLVFTGVFTVDLILAAQIFSILASLVVGMLLLKPKLVVQGPLHYFASSVRYLPKDIGMSLKERLDVFLITWLLGAYFGGLYAVAVVIGSLPTLVSQAVSNASFNLARHDCRRTQDDLLGFLQSSVLVASALGIVISLVVPWFVPWFFGEEFQESVPIIWVMLAIRSVGSSFSSIPEAALLATGREREVPAQGLIGLLFFAALAIPSGYFFGGVAFVAVFYLSEIVMGAIWGPKAGIHLFSHWAVSARTAKLLLTR